MIIIQKEKKLLIFQGKIKILEARDAILAISPLTERLTTALNKHMDYNIKLSDEGAKNAQEIKSTSMMIQTVISIGAILLVLVLGIDSTLGSAGCRSEKSLSERVMTRGKRSPNVFLINTMRSLSALTASPPAHRAPRLRAPWR